MNSGKRKYGQVLVVISLLVMVFHLLILVKVIPYSITWGGKLKNDSEMYVFETVSLLINLFFVYLVAQRVGMMPLLLSEKIVTILLWIFFGLFVLNTVGNIFATTSLERWFTLLTLANAFLIWKINRKSVNR
ncbi:MAG: hypothetical protein HOP30_02780 [Cyclobacteriaceae bacterium]|nr:hypothetical protein [Cyclobacteriaceae bacterium]